MDLVAGESPRKCWEESNITNEFKENRMFCLNKLEWVKWKTVIKWSDKKKKDLTEGIKSEVIHLEGICWTVLKASGSKENNINLIWGTELKLITKFTMMLFHKVKELKI